MENKQPIITLSIVSPVYRAEKIVHELVARVSAAIEPLSVEYEILLVEDGSPDGSWKKIEDACKANPKVKGVKLSRNFGQHYAISAGLAEASGDFVVVMDCDLQDNPVYIKTLLDTAREGYDIVYTHKRKREHSFFKNITARFFYTTFNYLSGSQHPNANHLTGSFSLLSRKAVDSFNTVKDFHRHYLMVLRNLGYRSTSIEVVHEKRFEGTSSYTLRKLISHAIDGITSQSDKLLHLSVRLGFLFCVASFVWASVLIVQYFVRGSLPGYTSLMVMLLLSTGLILSAIGIAGIYIGKIFEQVKQRPLYFIDKKVNF
ncbi:MAG: glycosyltransferase family 2 protein [Saprospiraceae bacterium]